MKILMTDAGKRFNREWIFRKLNHVFEPGGRYAITGSNGSGKSTLLQVIAGALAPSEGSVSYRQSTGPVAEGPQAGAGVASLPDDTIYTRVSFCAPYLELIEEMTAIEFLQFHQAFKPFLAGHTPASILDELGLSSAAGKQVRYYSSGMKQRVKLAQAIFAQAPVLLLDEPCTNLDQAGIDQYLALVEKYCEDKLVIVSSNDPQEYGFCTEVLRMSDWK
jgi:ABC-type multidrug transport system ATPase subunit